MEVFDKIDKLASPRLVEYWEQDPCEQAKVAKASSGYGRLSSSLCTDSGNSGAFPTGVKVEAQFGVGEYDIVILSARDSLGLDTWLKQEEYQIPAGAEPLLRPYVQNGAKLFVAKVDSTKVKFEYGQTQLSPLRFHYICPAGTVGSGQFGGHAGFDRAYSGAQATI